MALHVTHEIQRTQFLKTYFATSSSQFAFSIIPANRPSILLFISLIIGDSWLKDLKFSLTAQVAQAQRPTCGCSNHYTPNGSIHNSFSLVFSGFQVYRVVNELFAWNGTSVCLVFLGITNLFLKCLYKL